MKIYQADKNLPETKISQVAQMFTFTFKHEGLTSYIFDFSRDDAEVILSNLNILKAKEYLNSENIILLAEHDNEIIGVAALKKNTKSSLLKKLKIYFPSILKYMIPYLKIVNFKRVAEVNKLLNIDHKPLKNFYTLEAIGVKESSQGKGVGKKLLTKVEELSVKSEDSNGIYLYTAEIKNKDIYEYIGYKTIATKESKNISIYHMFKTV